MSDQELGEELHKPVIRNFKQRKVYSSFIGSIWSADLPDMKLISKFIKRFSLLLCIIEYE